MGRFFAVAIAVLLLTLGIAFADDAVKVSANCVVTHSGYRGTIVAPGVSKPSGKITKLECNGKMVELASDSMTDGVIATKQFGDISIRFASMVATVGAGDFTSVGPGRTAQERVIELYVPADKAKEFSSFLGK
jgi:hypothetical protein